MQIRKELRLDIQVEVTGIGTVLGGEEHQARAAVAVRRIAPAGNELHASNAVEQAEVGDVLQRVLQVGRGCGVVDPFELVGRLERETTANRDGARLIDRDAGNAAQQRVLIGVEGLALHHIDLRTGHRVRVDRHAALKGAPGRTSVRRSDHLERARERHVDGLLRSVENDDRDRVRRVAALEKRQRVRIRQDAQKTVGAMRIGHRRDRSRWETSRSLAPLRPRPESCRR